ncbi:uncharacterized protein DS421_9g258540 [Arachis hypogaea]|nr:uncharacterized protein DS421_9g258540 [Arachis hypogaea]
MDGLLRSSPFTHCLSFISSTLLTGCSVGFLLICLNHLRRNSTIFSTKDATPTLSLISSFLILSNRV